MSSTGYNRQFNINSKKRNLFFLHYLSSKCQKCYRVKYKIWKTLWHNLLPSVRQTQISLGSYYIMKYFSPSNSVQPITIPIISSLLKNLWYTVQTKAKLSIACDYFSLWIKSFCSKQWKLIHTFIFVFSQKPSITDVPFDTHKNKLFLKKNIFQKNSFPINSSSQPAI